MRDSNDNLSAILIVTGIPKQKTKIIESWFFLQMHIGYCFQINLIFKIKFIFNSCGTLKIVGYLRTVPI